MSRIIAGASLRDHLMLQKKYQCSNIILFVLKKHITVEGYINILKDLLLSFSLSVFTKRAKRHLITHSKFYFFDTGVFRSLRPAGLFDRPQEIDRYALEGLVCQHLVAWNAYSDNENKIFFWKTKSGIEVDFVLYGQNKIYAIEVKNSRNIRPNDLKGLKSFKEDYPEAGAILLYRGGDRLMKEEILCVPCDEFLKQLVSGKSIL